MLDLLSEICDDRSAGRIVPTGGVPLQNQAVVLAKRLAEVVITKPEEAHFARNQQKAAALSLSAQRSVLSI